MLTSQHMLFAVATMKNEDHNWVMEMSYSIDGSYSFILAEGKPRTIRKSF